MIGLSGKDRVLPAAKKEFEQRSNATLKGSLSTHELEDSNQGLNGKSRVFQC